MDYVFKLDVKVVLVASYNVGNDDDVHGQHFVIARSYDVKQGVACLSMRLSAYKEFSLKKDSSQHDKLK